MIPETNTEVLLDLLERLTGMLHWTLDQMTEEAFAWAPDADANSSAVTVWHVCRAWDLLKVRVLENQPAGHELWFRDGWAEKTGYDPRGLGYGGFGNLAGYTVEQMKQVPRLSVEDSLSYLYACSDALKALISGMEDASLGSPPPFWPEPEHMPESVYAVVVAFLVDGYQHLGEIRAIHALWEKQNKKG